MLPSATHNFQGNDPIKVGSLRLMGQQKRPFLFMVTSCMSHSQMDWTFHIPNPNPNVVWITRPCQSVRISQGSCKPRKCLGSPHPPTPIIRIIGSGTRKSILSIKILMLILIYLLTENFEPLEFQNMGCTTQKFSPR